MESINHCEQQVSDLKEELADVSHDIRLLDHDDDNVSQQEANLNKAIFNNCLQIQRLLQGLVMKPPVPTGYSGVNLPILNMPKFDGNILLWKSFWD